MCNRQVFSKVYTDGFGAEILSINLLRKLINWLKIKILESMYNIFMEK